MRELVCVLVVLLVGCDQGVKKPGRTETEAAMAAMERFEKLLCACKDAKCAQDVSDQMVKWSQEQVGNEKVPPKMSEADMKKAAAIGERMGRCMQVAMTPIELAKPEPATGPARGGTHVRIGGATWTPNVAHVYIDKRVANIVARDPAAVTVEAPPGTPGKSVDVTVVFEQGIERTLEGAFTYQ